MSTDDWTERTRWSLSDLVRRAEERLFLEEDRWWGDGSVLLTVCLGAWSLVCLAVWGPLFWVTWSFRGWPGFATPGRLVVAASLLGGLSLMAGRGAERVLRLRRPEIDGSTHVRWRRTARFAVPVWGLWLLHRSLGWDDEELPDPVEPSRRHPERSLFVERGRSWLWWTFIAQVALLVFLVSPLYAGLSAGGTRRMVWAVVAVGSSAVGAWATARVAGRMSLDLGPTDLRRRILHAAPRLWAVPFLGPLAGFVPSVLEQWPGRLEGLVTKIYPPRGRQREKSSRREGTRWWRRKG
jgi:hypothetical protein